MKLWNRFYSLILIVVVALFAVLPMNAHASMDKDGSVIVNGSRLTPGSAAWLQLMKERGLVALYLFNETSGLVRDVSGYRDANGTLEPLDLVIDDPIANTQEVIRTGSSIKIQFPTLIHSQGPAAKIHRECTSSGELSIEAWLKNADTAQLPRINPIRIVTMSNKVSPLRSGVPESEQLSSTNPSFVLGQEYVDNSRYKGIIRTSRARDGAMLGIGPNITKVNSLQHVIVSKNKKGVGRVYVSYETDDGDTIDALRTEVGNDPDLQGDFSNWDPKAIFGLGNEISYQDPAARKTDDSRNTTEDRAWLGELFLVAIYCKALEPTDINGDAAPQQDAYQSYKIDPTIRITENHRKAVLLYKRLAGVSTSIANPVIDQMASEIASGTESGWMRAAAIATSERDFYNITVKDFAGRMSTRDETVLAPLSDFSATIIGVVRDEISAQQLLTGNFTYQGDPKKAAVVSNTFEDIVSSNRHYEALSEGRFDLSRVLVQKSPQLISNGSGGAIPNPNPAGLLTTRAFMGAHAIAGTNRRLVEFTFREFLCTPIEKWADAYGPDNYVGRDVDRFPGGDHNKFSTTCKACHTGMDSLRGAFARFTFSNGVIKNAFLMQTENLNSADEQPNTMKQMPRGVASKMNHNEENFPSGHIIEDDWFENTSIRGSNAAQFGWSGPMTGYGVKEFGEMISKAKAFPKCMARRVYRSVCKREPASFDQPMLDKVADDFVSENYNLKKLFQRIAITNECLGN
ncbi:MAG: hypothetical protein KDD61_17495 [Bdellovibrionales bacterium]|nr:hypothetical protein [Bdellovibrionales bacterium]